MDPQSLPLKVEGSHGQTILRVEVRIQGAVRKMRMDLRQWLYPDAHLHRELQTSQIHFGVAAR